MIEQERQTLRAHVDHERAAIFVAEFLLWWHQAGRHYYGWGSFSEDEGLITLAEEAVSCLGGWRAACRMLRAQRRSGCSVHPVPNPNCSACPEPSARYRE